MYPGSFCHVKCREHLFNFIKSQFIQGHFDSGTQVQDRLDTGWNHTSHTPLSLLPLSPTTTVR